MAKSNGKGNGTEQRNWLSRSHNKELTKVLGEEEVVDVMADDIRHKEKYDEIDGTIAASKRVTKWLRKKNLLASLRSREITNNEKT